MKQASRGPLIHRALSDLVKTIDVTEEDVTRLEEPSLILGTGEASVPYARWIDLTIGYSFYTRNREAGTGLLLSDAQAVHDKLEQVPEFAARPFGSVAMGQVVSIRIDIRASVSLRQPRISFSSFNPRWMSVSILAR